MSEETSAEPVEGPSEAEEEQPTEEPVVEEPKEEAKIPNIFVHETEAGRALVVLDEGKVYPMDEKADAFVRDNNIPILANYPEGVVVVGSDRAADLVSLAKKLEASK